MDRTGVGMSNMKWIRFLKRIARRPILPGVVGRNVTIFKNDLFIVSYPKSGNTWTRFLIGNLFYRNQEVTFSNIEDLVPDIYQNTDRALLKQPAPRILKSHEYFDPRYGRVIYIVRDPRDVALSYYHYLIKIRAFEDGFPLMGFVERFMAGAWDSYGSWYENAKSWIALRDGAEGFLLLRYEDLLHDLQAEMNRIATFLKLDVSNEDIESAIEGSSFERMRALEEKEASAWKAIKKSRMEKPFMRSGKAEEWRNAMPTECVALIEEQWGDLMRQLGYDMQIDASSVGGTR